MTEHTMVESARSAGVPIAQAVAVFMLHPETFDGSIAAGYQNPLAGYVVGRGGVLGDATGATVSSVFVMFEPTALAALWDEGVAVHGAAGGADVYWQQAAEFARKHLAGADGLDRIAALGEKIIATTPPWGVPLFAGWREMPLADDAPARALQVMFVLRELRAAVHFNALVSPESPRSRRTCSTRAMTTRRRSAGPNRSPTVWTRKSATPRSSRPPIGGWLSCSPRLSIPPKPTNSPD